MIIIFCLFREEQFYSNTNVNFLCSPKLTFFFIFHNISHAIKLEHFRSCTRLSDQVLLKRYSPMHLFIELSNMAFPLQMVNSTPWHTVKVRYNITTVLEIWKKRRKQDPSKLSSVKKSIESTNQIFRWYHFAENSEL